MLDNNVWCVIMAGGAGTRFWPVSTANYPKQFKIINKEKGSFIQDTARRFNGLVPPERILIVTNRKYVDLVHENLPDIPEENILKEPYYRDTATCIAYAMYTILQRDPNGFMVIVPSDHIIDDHSKFRKVLEHTTKELQQYDVLATIGIKPTRPDTNYGYIQADGIPQTDMPIKVKTFTEKPDKELASVFYTSGEFLWNSGIFLWKADTIRREFERLMPQLVASFRGWEGALGTPAEKEFLEKIYSDAQKISIDYAILERTSNIWVYPAEMGWKDLGTWEAFYSSYPQKDVHQNASNVQLLSLDSSGNMLISENQDKLVAVCGLENFTVVDTGNVLMICPTDDKRLRELVSLLADPEFEKYR